MSKIAEKLRAATSKRAGASALLVLEDGAVFAGTSCGAPGEAFGEICFNTSLEGYWEIATDPSYAGQIVVLTYPQVGNYGVNADDAQAERPALRALVVRDMCPTPSSWRSQESLCDYLAREGVVAIEGVDTRAPLQGGRLPLRREALHLGRVGGLGLRTHCGALGHLGRRGAGDEPRRRVPLQRPG